MRPRERRETGEQDLFRSRLDQIIDMNSLVTLARTVDWNFLEQAFGAVYTDGPGEPPLPTRLMAGSRSSSTPMTYPTRCCASAGWRTPPCPFSSKKMRSTVTAPEVRLGERLRGDCCQVGSRTTIATVDQSSIRGSRPHECLSSQAHLGLSAGVGKHAARWGSRGLP